MMRRRFLSAFPFRVVYEGEGEGGDGGAGGGATEGGGGEGGDGGAGGGTGAGAGGGTKKKVVFTPEQQALVNAQLAEERRKGKTAHDQLIAELETQKQLASTSEAQRQQIEERIEQLKGEYLTKAETDKKTMDKQLKDEQKRREAAEKKAADWENLYTQERLDGDLIGAANEHKAYNAATVTAVLRPKARLVDELDAEGKPTGKKVTRIKTEKTDDAGKVQILEMTPSEAVKHLAEQPEQYGNLFISAASGGVGGNNLGGGRARRNGNEPPEDPEEYRKWRAEEKKAGRM